MLSKKNIAIVCNPVAAHSRATSVAEKIIQCLQEKNIAHTYFLEHWAGNFQDFTEVWIVGGDGTLNYFINRYPNIQLPLSIFPGGSGNDFRWMLYGDKTVEQQIDFVLNAGSKKVDAGTCNEKLFLNGIGIGFDGAIVKDLLGKKMLAGKASYLLSILKHIVGYTEKECTIHINGEVIHEPCFMISVAGGKRYGGGFLVAPNASINDSLLDVNIVGRIAPFKRIKYLPVIEKGEHLHLPFIQYKQSGKVFIQSLVALHAHIDGEYFASKEFIIECLPSRFSFIC
jgi:YegS/Rv2252/BmrU family lipid kinase